MTLFFALALTLAGVSADAADEPATGQLNLTVALVASDLSIRPVPKWTFSIRAVDTAGEPLTVVTSFSGTAQVALPPGRYRITSDAAVELDNREFRWDHEFTVTSGEIVTTELSNDNALIAISSGRARDVQMDEGRLYQLVKQRVFKVLSESGHGSGFLIDAENGLIATNHHVIANSDYLAVKIDDDSKFAAKLIAADNVNDLAIIQVHPRRVSHLEAVVLADDAPSSPPVSVGDRVVAIGSPLATETILTSGLVSKVEASAIYSDVNINPGNSGGPLFNSQREVIGINTFGVLGRGTPGIAGIVRVHLLIDLLQTTTDLDFTAPPDDQVLPVESAFKFPADALREAAMSRNFDSFEYHIEAGKFDVQLMTPVLIAGLEVADDKAAAAFRNKRSKKKKTETKEYTPGQDFYEWRQYVGDYRAVVTVQAVPEISMTGGSVFAVIMLGGSAPQKFKFKADFDRMELWRGDVLVRPIHPRRWTNVVSFEQGVASMNDVGFYGSYEYPPEAFKPGETLTLKVWKQGKPKPIVRIIEPHQQIRVWNDFTPYFAALDDRVAASTNK
jgi:S1-C subfamily serine protease